MSGEWVEWHRSYDEDPSMRGRLRLVQLRIRETLDRAPPGPIRVISACAGDGRDLLGALEGHPRARDVRARLVEQAPALAVAGREQAAHQGLETVEVRLGDASHTDAYLDAVPADLLLFCGVFGNVSDADIRGTIGHLPEFCGPGATVVWTRGRFEPDLTPSIRSWFAEEGFEELSFDTVPGSTKAVGAHRLAVPPRPFRPGVRLFTFLPPDERPWALADRRTRERGGPTSP